MHFCSTRYFIAVWSIWMIDYAFYKLFATHVYYLPILLVVIVFAAPQMWTNIEYHSIHQLYPKLWGITFVHNLGQSAWRQQPLERDKYILPHTAMLVSQALRKTAVRQCFQLTSGILSWLRFPFTNSKWVMTMWWGGVWMIGLMQPISWKSPVSINPLVHGYWRERYKKACMKRFKGAMENTKVKTKRNNILW